EILHSYQDKVDRKKGGEGIRRWLVNNIPRFISTVEDQEDGYVDAIGCGFGGPVNSHEGRVMDSIQICGWKGFPLKDWFEEHFERPAIVVNDSNAATWGEYRRGFGQGCQHFFYTNLGSGIGGGFVISGALFDGQGFGAGEFGHTYVPDWTADKPDAGVEIESLCSGWAIESRLNAPDYLPRSSRLFQVRSERDESITARDLGEAARLGDPFALKEIDRIADSMGYGLANVLSLTGVERIAIGGGVSNLGEILIGPIRKYTEKYAFISNKGRYTIGRCELGEKIVLVGAILLAKKAMRIN
ncbi:MAG: ROK family protein, partial [Brevefilum sp.]